MAIAKWRLPALVALGAAGAFLFWLLPPAPARVDIAGWGDLASRTVAGAYHVHTTRSDGHGDRQQVAGAAARAGLKFVILTDHGDATRPPDPPAYIDGVLLLDAVEISTAHGHLVALDMARAPYPLGGSADAVVEDVHRLGGFAIAAHPDSPKPTLRWTDTSAPIDGIEWLNADSEWRDEDRTTLVRAGLAYFLRPAGAIASLLDLPESLERWTTLSRTRPVVGLAAVDAHGGAGRRMEDQNRTLFGSIGIPSYEASFRTLSNRVVLDTPLAGEASADARAIYAAIRRGRVFSAIDAIASPALLDYSFESGLERAALGTALADDADGALVARVPAPPGSELAILRDGRVVATTHGTEIRHVLTGARGAYQVRVLAPGAPGMPPMPWLVSNSIGFFADGASAAGAVGPTGAGASGAAGAPFPWRIEKDPSSSATLRSAETSATLEFRLAEGARRAQFVAMATDLNAHDFARIDLRLTADRPMRVSVQLRSADGRRWGRSYYVDPAGTVIEVPVAALLPVDGGGGGPIAGRDATSLLLVVDLTNAAPGRTGNLKVLSSAFVK